MARTAREIIASLPKERQARIQQRSQELVEEYMLDRYDLLSQIQVKPGLYIGAPSLQNLHLFLAGYQFARRQMGLPLSVQEREFRDFQPWLQQRFGMHTTTSWAQLIAAQCTSEEQAFVHFFDLLQTFRNGHSKKK